MSPFLEPENFFLIGPFFEILIYSGLLKDFAINILLRLSEKELIVEIEAGRTINEIIFRKAMAKCD